VENKNDVTAFDDPRFTKTLGGKDACATRTTCNVFRLLDKIGISTSFVEQVSDTEFIVRKCTMVPLEVIARRFAVGSYLKRFPGFATPAGELAHRFHNLLVEFFLKTTNGGLTLDGAETPLISGLVAEKGEEDPFIVDPINEERWELRHPKQPIGDDSAVFTTVNRPEVEWAKPEQLTKMEKMTQDIFWALEAAWHALGLRLIDFKIEFGYTEDGQLVVSDVIDNDSWRLQTFEMEDLSKQSFRDGEALDKVAAKYGLVAELSNRLLQPDQAVVLWTGSPSDAMPCMELVTNGEHARGLSVVEVVLSGHKSTVRVVKKLRELETQFPQGGVIIAKVGMSNGLGPILAAHTHWPVIAVPANASGPIGSQFMDDVWSSLRAPSNVPLATIINEKNALFEAMRILSLSNPAAYMMSRRSFEGLDD
jgi:phosphoribosylaminoimidazole carboxylase/phosphoribosylaminoimidazole-succinocarboxamide synthase